MHHASSIPFPGQVNRLAALSDFQVTVNAPDNPAPPSSVLAFAHSLLDSYRESSYCRDYCELYKGMQVHHFMRAEVRLLCACAYVIAAIRPEDAPAYPAFVADQLVGLILISSRVADEGLAPFSECRSYMLAMMCPSVLNDSERKNWVDLVESRLAPASVDDGRVDRLMAALFGTCLPG